MKTKLFYCDARALCYTSPQDRSKSLPPDLIKFEEFELDCACYELRRRGRALKLEKIPMELLMLLATAEGRLVSREEIEERLWGNGVFVDAEHGINTAIRKIRQALGDDPEHPRFVQTVQRKGYRFIAHMTTGVAEGQSQDNGAANREESVRPLGGEPSRMNVPEPVAVTPDHRQIAEKPASHRYVWIGIAATLLLGWPLYKLASAAFERHAAQPVIRSLAVLPLENISGDASEEYFADGMTDELITTLAKYPALRVISRTSVVQYKKAHRPLPEIARELGVDGVIEGSVSRSQGRVRVRAQLIYAPTDTHLWAESYDRDAGDILSLQQELARNIAERVNRAASAEGAATAPPHGSSNQAARDAYYRGRSLWSAGQYVRSGNFFREAIRLDPNYAAAYAGIADSYTAAAVSGTMRPLDAMPKAREAVRKGLELDDEAAEVHHTYAAVKLFFDWDWNSAEREMERALSLNPGIAEAHHLHSYILEAANRTEESLKEDKLCGELDPFGRSWSYPFALYRNRRFDEAIVEFQQRAEIVPSGGFEHELMGLAYAYKGDGAKATAEWKQRYVADGQPEIASKMEEAFRSGGIEAVWELKYELIKEAAKTQYVSQLDLADAAASAGHKAGALTYLERAYEERQPLMVRLLHNPELDSLREEPRFKAIVKKMGLPGAE